MKILRTPDDSFENLTGYPFKPNYIKILDSTDQALRIHYIDEGPIDAEPGEMRNGVKSALDSPCKNKVMY
ncbi:MAG: hypothetical protein JRL30_20465 [Deltaproteobacteria bacterium]|nr:hypothetical protein [Deltaproteobacteria bacterium]